MQIATSFFETITQEILLRLRETKLGIVEVEEEVMLMIGRKGELKPVGFCAKLFPDGNSIVDG